MIALRLDDNLKTFMLDSQNRELIAIDTPELTLKKKVDAVELFLALEYAIEQFKAKPEQYKRDGFILIGYKNIVHRLTKQVIDLLLYESIELEIYRYSKTVTLDLESINKLKKP